MTIERELPPLSDIAAKMRIIKEKDEIPITVAEFDSVVRSSDSTVESSSSEISSEIDIDKSISCTFTRWLPDDFSVRDCLDPLTAEQAFAIMGDRNHAHAGSPGDTLNEPIVVPKLDIDSKPLSKITHLSANIAHNLQIMRAYYSASDVIVGFPITAEFGVTVSRTSHSAWPHPSFIQYLYAAYSGQIPRFDPATPSVCRDTDNENRDETISDDTSSTSNDMTSTIATFSPIIRPNGEKYYPRRLVVPGKDDKKIYDTELVRRARERGLSILLYGEPGTGKTALFEAALDGLITANGHGDFEVSDFFGSFIETDNGSFVWVDGPLLIAAKEGRPFFVDDASLIDPRVMSVLYPAMDGRGEINVTTNPSIGVVKTAPGFYVVAACNPNAPGSIMSEAFLSRFALHISVTTDYELMKRLGVPQNIVIVAQNLKTQVNNGTVVRCPQARDLLDYKRIYDEFGERVALSNLIARADPGDRSEYIAALSSTFGTNVRALEL